MIRILNATEAELLAAIEAHRPGWLTRAEARTNDLADGKSDEKLPSLWSEVKKVYMDLQHSKCAYCEKEVEDQPIEQDVEHFRPKKQVTRWALPKALAGEGIVIEQPASGTEPGYLLLAYNPLNYAAACKTCNSARKKNYFPIAGTRKAKSRNPATMGGEQPFLIYPVGDLDGDPEDLIEFTGLSPQAKAKGFGRKRALVTIWLLQLNRKWLQKDRALEIMRYYLALDRAGRPPRDEIALGAEKIIQYMQSPRARHANCLRSFRRLYDSDRAAAGRIFEKCTRLVGTLSL